MIIGIYGPSHAGKTELISRLVRFLSDRGFSVGYVKHTAEGFDLAGKDTWRVYESGAKFVCAISNDELFIRINESYTLDSIEKFIPFVDVIFVEGFRDFPIPKIKIGECETRENTIFEYRDNFDEILSWILRELEEIKKTERASVRLYVNDKKIFLKGYVQTLLSEVLLAIVRTLKDVDKNNLREVHVTVRIS